MTLLQLEYFFSVAECLSFSKAAEKHYTSQPSISRKIAQLESELGIHLFQRNRHSVQLTPQGKLLYKELHELYLQARAAYDRARQLQASSSGRLNIGYLQEMNIGLLLPCIKDFKTRYPNVDITFEGYGFKTLREKLIDGTLDIAFMLSFELQKLPYIEQKVFFPTQAYIVVSVSHPLAQKPNLTLNDLKNEHFIVASETSFGTEFVLGQCQNAGFMPSKVIRSATSDSIIMYVESCTGVAIMDASNRFYEDPKFRFVPIMGKNAEISVNVAWRKDNQNHSISLFDDTVCSPRSGC